MGERSTGGCAAAPAAGAAGAAAAAAVEEGDVVRGEWGAVVACAASLAGASLSSAPGDVLPRLPWWSRRAKEQQGRRKEGGRGL